MRIRDQSRIDERPPNYDPNGDQFSMCLHVGGTYDDKGYVGGNIHKFDHIDAKVYTLSALETFAENAGYLVNSIMYSRDEDEGDQGSLGSRVRVKGQGGSVGAESKVRVDEGQGVDGESQGSGDEDVVQDNQDFNSAKGSDSEGEVDRCPTWNPNNLYDPNLKLKMIFSNKWEFIDVVHSDCVLKKRDIQLVKNDRVRVYARCKGVGYPWKVHANNITGEPSFQIRTYNSTHTCAETYHITSIRSKWLNGRYGYQFKNDPKRKVTHFQTELMVELGVNVTPHQAYKCKKLALEDETGNANFQYSLLWDYAQEIRRTNPGSTILIGTDNQHNGPVLFDRMYFCFNACKVGFYRGCRPLIDVDGTHLKGLHGGILLTAVGVYPNNNIFPIAYAVVGKETGDTWEWFLGILKRDLEIQKDDNMTFISDKQKGLIQAFQNIFPNAAHRFCVRHLYGNLRNAGFRGLAFKTALYKASKSTTKNEFLRSMHELKELSPMVSEWLSDKPADNWSKSHFSSNAKCDMVMNNICESFNAAILPARELPILSMLEWIMNYLMERMQKNRDRAFKGKKWKGLLCPKIQKIIDEDAKKVGNCIPLKSDDKHYQVRMIDGTQFYVDLEKSSCGCRMWDLTGIPCIHVIRAIYCQRLSPEDFTDGWYKVDTYKMVYENPILPINGRDEWEPTGITLPLPPKIGRHAGRPRIARRRESDEPVEKKRRERQILSKCSKCCKPGHNRRACKTQESEVDGAENVRGNEGVHVDEHVMGEGNAGIQTEAGHEGGNEAGNEGGNEAGNEGVNEAGNEGVQDDEGGLDQGEVDFWDITSQLSDELSSKQSYQHMMSNAACYKNIFKHLGKKKLVAASGSTPTRAPPSMYQQHARSYGDGDLAKKSFKFVTLKNLKSFMKK
ncbi:hypothetical protein ACS0TY_016875 [Phlomoides rotata]